VLRNGTGPIAGPTSTYFGDVARRSDVGVSAETRSGTSVCDHEHSAEAAAGLGQAWALARGRSEGLADFDAGACVVSCKPLGRDSEVLHLPGRNLERHRGRWRQKAGPPFVGASLYSPIWLVEEVLDLLTFAGGVLQELTHKADRARATPTMPGPERTTEPMANGVFDVTLTDLGSAEALQPPEEDAIDTGELLAHTRGKPVVATWARRLPAILPADIVLAYRDGLIFTLTHEPSQRGLLGSVTDGPLILIGTPTERLQRMYASHGADLQQLLSERHGTDWPAPGARVHVAVTDNHIRVEWSAPQRQPVALPAIPRSELGF
jgi:hypothetical protein